MPMKISDWLVLVSNERSVMIPSMLLLSAHNLPPAGARREDPISF